MDCAAQSFYRLDCSAAICKLGGTPKVNGKPQQAHDDQDHHGTEYHHASV